MCLLWAVSTAALAQAPTSGSSSTGGSDAPQYKVDPFWPKQLPNNWIMGQVGGLAVDSQDHVWVLQRPRSATPDELGAEQKSLMTACCAQTPAVLEFDAEGNLLQSWGGPGHVPQWPQNEHGIWVDKQRNVWIGGNAPTDRRLLKFTSAGRLLMEIGGSSDAPIDNQDVTMLGGVAGIEVDDAAHEVYVADGYLNSRVVVFDSETGKFKRGWGAYGVELSKVSNGAPSPYIAGSPPGPQFRNVHCTRLSSDGLVYVCDRGSNRIQEFTKQGKFLREFRVRQETLGIGSVWALAFSSDAKQQHLLVADGANNVVWTLRRSDGAVVASFGHNGRNAGQFHWVHQAGADSKGNLYTGEVDTGKRVQKFVLQSVSLPR